jgi:hypothetical protein
MPEQDRMSEQNGEGSGILADTIIEHGTIITMDPQRRVIEDGSVAIEAGRIVAVGPADEVAAAHPHASKRIDARHKAVLPGLIDGHTHAGHAMIRTAGAGDTKAWYDTVHDIYNHGSGPEFWRLEAAMAATERLRFGTTTATALLGGGDSAAPTPPIIRSGKARRGTARPCHSRPSAMSAPPPWTSGMAPWTAGCASPCSPPCITMPRRRTTSPSIGRRRVRCASCPAARG